MTPRVPMSRTGSLNSGPWTTCRPFFSRGDCLTIRNVNWGYRVTNGSKSRSKELNSTSHGTGDEHEEAKVVRGEVELPTTAAVKGAPPRLTGRPGGQKRGGHGRKGNMDRASDST